MFITNAEEVIKRIRNHASIGIYVGRNKGNPTAVIDTALRALIAMLHPGSHYISNSAMGVVSGGGLPALIYHGILLLAALTYTLSILGCIDKK